MTSRLFSARTLRSLVVAIVALMVVGSFADWQISCALYDPSSPFGNFFAAFGMHPAMLGIAVAGELLIMGHSLESKSMGALQCVLGLALAAFGIYKCCTEPAKYLDVSGTLLAALGVATSAVVLLVVWRLCQEAPREELVRAGVAIGVAIGLQYLLINLVIKGPWARARFRLVQSDERAYFMPWWHAGDSLRDTLAATGVDAEEFRSFPSGHTGCATALVCLGFLPCVSERLRGKERLLAGVGLVWTALVALSRIIMGAHYLTDVTMGFAIGLASILFAEWLVYGRKRER